MTQSSPGHPKQFTENSHKLPSAFPTPVLAALLPSRGPSGLKGRKNRELGKGELDRGKRTFPIQSWKDMKSTQSSLGTCTLVSIYVSSSALSFASYALLVSVRGEETAGHSQTMS